MLFVMNTIIAENRILVYTGLNEMNTADLSTKGICS